VTDYEVLIMLDPELAEDRQQEVVDRIRKQVVEGGGVWETHAPWGRRRLAYEIQHKNEGVYHLITFAASAEVLSEVSRLLKIDDGVLRHLAVRRVKGSSTVQPAPLPAPVPASVETLPAATAEAVPAVSVEAVETATEVETATDVETESVQEDE
jgi:small subunit ribosomal protein S6